MIFTNLLNKLKISRHFGFLMQSQNTIMSAAFVLGISSGISAVLGLLKSRLLTYYFGVSDELGIFYTADRIPNLVYSVLVVGALSTIFIPVFTGLLKENKSKAWETASAIISIGVMTFLGIGFFVFLFSPQIINVISLGQFTPDQVILGANLMRIMILAQIVLVVSSFVTSVLHSFKYFIVPALAPVVYNLGMILGILVLSGPFGIYGPAYGVVIGAFFHLVVQIPLARKADFRYSFSLNWRNSNVLEMISLLPPRILSVIFNQLVSTINNSLAILISTSSVVVLKFAIQLQFLPVSLFGASIAAASLPVLSENTSPNDISKFKQIFLTTFHQMLFLVLPASVILIILRIPIVRLVYGVSNFPWEATVKTSYALAFFGLSIFAQASVYLLTRAFYSFKDTLTPVKVSVLTITLNVLLSVLFVKVFGFGIWSIALAFSVTSLIDMGLLLILLSKKLGGIEINSILIPFTKISYAALFMGISLYGPLKLLDIFVFDTTRTLDLLILTVLVTLAGVGSYLFFTWVFKVEEIRLFYSVLRKLKIVNAVPIQPAVEFTTENKV